MKPNLRLQAGDIVELVLNNDDGICLYPTELVYVVEVTENIIRYTWDKTSIGIKMNPCYLWDELKAVNRLWRD